MDYIQTVEKFPLFFPVFEAKLHITSERLIDFDPFTRFVFQMIGNGEQLEAIKDITELKSHVILEEIHRLQGWRFFEERDESYHLTVLGRRYLKLMEFVDNLNKEAPKVLINAFNGKIMPPCEHLFKADECMPKLKVNVVRELIQNKNFSNSHSFFMEQICFTQPNSQDLSKEELESIQVWLECNPRTQYYRTFIKEVPTDMNEKGVTLQHDLAIQTGVVPINIELHHPMFEVYRHIMPTLKQMKGFDQSLLSTKALNLIKLEGRHALAQANLPTYYYEQLTGKLVSMYADYAAQGQLFKLKLEQKNMPDSQALQQLLKHIDIPDEFNSEVSLGDVVMRTSLISSWLLT